jgi:hypothetical protein
MLRKGRLENTADLNALNKKVLQALAQENDKSHVSPFKRLLVSAIDSPLLALTAAGLVFFIPLHGVVQLFGLSEPVYGFILNLLIP